MEEDEINKIVEKEQLKEDQVVQPKKKEILEVLSDEDHIKLAREFVIDLSSYTMFDNEKRKKFSKDLKENTTINEYVNNQALFKLLRTNNEHIKCLTVYSYLYLKNLNTL